jgi:Ca2+/H+ antiporter
MINFITMRTHKQDEEYEEEEEEEEEEEDEEEELYTCDRSLHGWRE